MSKDYDYNQLYRIDWSPKCPCCGKSDDVCENGGLITAYIDSGYVQLPKQCKGCGATWIDEYEYSGFIRYTDGNPL